MVDSFPQKVITDFSHTISIEQFGVYAISITARCQGKRVFGLQKEQNLRLEINGTQFREIPPEAEVSTQWHFLDGDEVTQQAWSNSYYVAVDVINGTTSDPTDGATYFHSSDLSQEVFLKNSVPGAIFVRQIDDFLFYKDPNDL